MVDLPALPDDALLRVNDILRLRLWPGSRAALWAAAGEGRFPTPIKVGVNTTAWRLGDIREWQRGLVSHTAEAAA